MDNQFKERIDRVVTVLAKASCQDFDHAIPLSEKEDELFELEVGVNVLLQDLAGSKRANEAQLAEIEAKNREIAERQSLALRELATPIISVWKGVLALPVIGVVDTERSAEMMDTLLARVVSEQATHVVIDITGVAVLDTRTADHFVRMARAVGLLGSTCFLTGISPAIAQTLAQLGIDTSSARTVRRLSDALQFVFAELGTLNPTAS
jgi:rsbT co-antagonist protein RsbR